MATSHLHSSVPLFEPLIAGENASLCTFDEMFDEANDGILFTSAGFDCDPTQQHYTKSNTVCNN